jgi:cytochrome P450
MGNLINDITITSINEAKEVYRHKEMRQALYDAGKIVMSDVLVNLHGDEHRARRRLENRLFRRETLVHYERDLFPSVIEKTLGPYVLAGRAEIVELSHQLMMNLAALNAGVDRQLGSAEETARLYAQMMKFIEGATLEHTTRNIAEVEVEIAESMADFNREFLTPSIERRQKLLAAVASGEAPETSLPLDVLTVLLRNEDSLQLPQDVILREISFFLLAGAHTSATAFVRTLHNLFLWSAQHPEDAELIRSDRSFVQKAVYETIRLNPSSPTGMRWALADITLKSGRFIPKGSRVIIDLNKINRDQNVFGLNADVFDPHRVPLVEGVAPWGLSFGQGMHACIGQELAAGLAERTEDTSEFEYGLVSVAVQSMIDRGVCPDQADLPVMDTSTTRPYWGRYQVLFI